MTNVTGSSDFLNFTINLGTQLLSSYGLVKGPPISLSEFSFVSSRNNMNPEGWREYGSGNAVYINQKYNAKTFTESILSQHLSKGSWVPP